MALRKQPSWFLQIFQAALYAAPGVRLPESALLGPEHEGGGVPGGRSAFYWSTTGPPPKSPQRWHQDEPSSQWQGVGVPSGGYIWATRRPTCGCSQKQTNQNHCEPSWQAALGLHPPVQPRVWLGLGETALNRKVVLGVYPNGAITVLLLNHL